MDCVIRTPLGPMLFEEREGAVTALRFAAEAEDSLLPPPETELAKRTEAWLRAYFAGKNPAVDLPLAPAGTAFQRRVWQACCGVPYGETRSYGELARQIGCRSARAVGAALGRNPVWLLIPCHRIVGSGGGLTGYAGGLEKKAALLRLEKNR
ncbi:MAG: methylated-DNA--[Oscillospiraceae bacterium]|nr:methylated-DNA--[protein]-cysteine S-methyltransferase [Oscillospiraceae bacterium]